MKKRTPKAEPTPYPPGTKVRFKCEGLLNGVPGEVIRQSQRTGMLSVRVTERTHKWHGDTINVMPYEVEKVTS